jgi:hypothetical protein
VLNIGDADLTLEDGGQSFGYAVAVGDLDGDDLPDLAVGDPTTPTCSPSSRARSPCSPAPPSSPPWSPDEPGHPRVVGGLAER